MKKFSKVLVVALAAMLLVFGLTACGGNSNLTDTGTMNDGKIIVGTNPEFPPFEVVSKTGIVTDSEGKNKYDGIDMAIIKAIAEENGLEVEIANLEFDSLLVALQNGQLDAIISGMTITEERAKAVDFTDPYFKAAQVMIVKEDSDIKKAADMKDKKIVAIAGYTGETVVKEMQKEGGEGTYQLTSLKKGPDAILEIVNGKEDVLVIDSITAEEYIKQHEGLKIVEDDEAFGAEEYGIAVQKGNSALLKILNDGIKKLQDDGTITKLYDQYKTLQ